MPHNTGREVLRGACALTLGDEPLAGGVEPSSMQLWVNTTQVSIPLDDSVQCEVREQPASFR